MILPWLAGFLSLRSIPMTCLLLGLNFFVYIATFAVYDEYDSRLEKIVSDHRYLDSQGAAFSVMISRGENQFSPLLQKLSSQSLGGDSDAKRLLGHLAIRNVAFMSQAERYDFAGDEVAMEHWRERFSELKDVQAGHPSYIWGISRVKQGWMQYFSYQFSHGGLSHLVFNMMFLLVFGAFIETRLGGSFVILTYLGSGIVGAGVYSLLSGISSSPLVGASAAVSGLISLVGLGWIGRERLKYFYWLLPFEGYFGFTLLPSWLVLLVFMLPDIGGYLSAMPEFGSVAFSAHIGGALCGGLVACAWRLGWLTVEIDEPGAGEPPDQIRRAS